jgi:prepilin-type N-terminal cleavage/methylation domain-containing protein
MGTPNQNRSRRRPGFTLVEMLVVIAIIAFLFSMLVLLGPAILKSEQASRGAQALQGSLFIAREQALRDHNPYGIRLLRESNNSASSNYNVVRSFQYIQQPGDFTGGTVSVTNASTTVNFVNIDLTGGLTDPATYPVQPGDYIQVGTDPFHQIQSVSTTTSLVLVNPYSGATNAGTTQYKIARGPRPVAGEDTIFLPEDVIVDISVSPPFSKNWTGNLDILFAPSGAILGTAGQQNKIILWVRDIDPNKTKEQTLITVFARTGQIGAYPVDNSSGNPYEFTYDPRTGGL